MDMLHIKINHETNLQLKRLAKVRGMNISDLVRQALINCYQLDLLGISDQQKQALEAYKGGFISLGKLSELMGRTLLDMRLWLTEHGISLQTGFSEDDVENAQ